MQPSDFVPPPLLGPYTSIVRSMVEAGFSQRAGETTLRLSSPDGDFSGLNTTREAFRRAWDFQLGIFQNRARVAALPGDQPIPGEAYVVDPHRMKFNYLYQFDVLMADSETGAQRVVGRYGYHDVPLTPALAEQTVIDDLLDEYPELWEAPVVLSVVLVNAFRSSRVRD